MAEIRCRFCDGIVSLGKAPPGARVSAECRECGSLFWATTPEPSGFETVRHPEALKRAQAEPESVPAAFESDALDARPSTGTLFLIPGQDLNKTVEPAPVTTIRRANLILDGVRPTQLPITGSRTEVGRKGTHIVVPDPALSASHFVIEAHGESYVLRDLGSSNGTRLNGYPIRSSKLVSGDTIFAGQTKFSFRIEEVIPFD